MDQMLFQVRLVNHGPACSLRGYPQHLSGKTLTGHLRSIRVRPESAEGEHGFTSRRPADLATGDAAEFVLHAAYGCAQEVGGDHPEHTYRQLRFDLPHTHRQMKVGFPPKTDDPQMPGMWLPGCTTTNVTRFHAAVPSAKEEHTASSPTGSAGSTCQAKNLRLSVGGLVSEETGQNTVILILRNTGDRACTLRGYPAVEMVSAAARRLPFKFRHRSDMMLSNPPPATVPLPPGHRAFIVINKYRCDLGDKATTTRVQVTPPGDSTTVATRLTHREMGWCGAGDPGSTITVSPVVASIRKVLR